MLCTSAHDRPTPNAVLSEGVIGLLMRWLPAGDVRPTSRQTAAFRAQQAVGDPVADALVAAMRRERRGRPQLETALDDGLDAVADPLPELVAFIETLETEPYWLDRELLAVGARAMNRIPLDTLLSLTAAVTLPGSYVSPRVNDVLMRGGDLHSRAAGRVVETVTWLVECAGPGGMERSGDGFRTTARVRIIHAYIRAGVGALEDWDHESNGTPVNQLHYAVTMIPLVAVVVGSVALGHLQSAHEREGTLHLYRYMGHLMGIVPELQIVTMNDLMRLAWLAAWSEYEPDASSRDLTHAVLNSIDQLRDLREETSLQRVRAWGHRRAHHDLTRLVLGPSYAEATGLHPLSLMAYALPVVTAGNAARYFARRLVPGELDRAARRGHDQRVNRLAEISERVRTEPFRRDDAVETVRDRHGQLVDGWSVTHSNENAGQS